MDKVTYQGQTYEVDLKRMPIHEGLAVQRKTGFRAIELGEKLKLGDWEAMAAYAWVFLKFKMGRDVEYEDICDGTHPVDWQDFQIETSDGEAGPTVAAEATTSA